MAGSANCCLMCFFNETELLALKAVDFPFGKADKTINTRHPISREDILSFEQLLEDHIDPHCISTLVTLVSSIYSPIGFPKFKRSGNSSGKTILSLLLKASMPKVTVYRYIPETVTCNGYVYRIHVSTHLSQQPSSVKDRTQDVLLVAACNTEAPNTVFTILTEHFQHMPCLLVADTDTSSLVIKKQAQLYTDLQVYKKKFMYKNVGLLLNDLILYAVEDSAERNDVKEFSLHSFNLILTALEYINGIIHKLVDQLPLPQQIEQFVTSQEDENWLQMTEEIAAKKRKVDKQ